MGGAMCNDDNKPLGCLLVVEADDREAVETLLDDAPYGRAGLFERVDVRPWQPVLGDWLD